MGGGRGQGNLGTKVGEGRQGDPLKSEGGGGVRGTPSHVQRFCPHTRDFRREALIFPTAFSCAKMVVFAWFSMRP